MEYILLRQSNILQQSFQLQLSQSITSIKQHIFTHFTEYSIDIHFQFIKLLLLYIPHHHHLTNKAEFLLEEYFPEQFLEKAIDSKYYHPFFQFIRFISPMPFHRIVGSTISFALFKTIGNYFSEFILSHKSEFIQLLLTDISTSLSICQQYVNMSRYCIDQFIHCTQSIDFLFWFFDNETITDEFFLSVTSLSHQCIELIEKIAQQERIKEPYKTKFIRILVLCSVELLSMIYSIANDLLLEEMHLVILRNYIEFIEWNDIISFKCFILTIGDDNPTWLTWNDSFEYYDDIDDYIQFDSLITIYKLIHCN